MEFEIITHLDICKPGIIRLLFRGIIIFKLTIAFVKRPEVGESRFAKEKPILGVCSFFNVIASLRLSH